MYISVTRTTYGIQNGYLDVPKELETKLLSNEDSMWDYIQQNKDMIDWNDPEPDGHSDICEAYMERS